MAFWPLNAARFVKYGPAGAGAANVSPAPIFVGLNVPELSEPLPIFDEVKRWLEPGQGHTLYGAGGCTECNQTGYTQRTGVFEVLSISKGIRKLILERQPAQASGRRQPTDQPLRNDPLSAIRKDDRCALWQLARLVRA